ncbi:MAG TPA: hypothetical protein O0X27_03570 [Methanocorpusculum sp.]|nr:hypothetical protein [Methanocorpusculum sp.]
MRNSYKLICGILLLLGVVFGAGCVDNGIQTDHANESIVGTWICDSGLANDVIVITFNGDGTANLVDTLVDQSVLMNNYTWNRQEAVDSYIAVSGSGERVVVQYHPGNVTLIDNAGNIFRKEQ